VRAETTIERPKRCENRATAERACPGNRALTHFGF
jgi:hypothetical protein